MSKPNSEERHTAGHLSYGFYRDGTIYLVKAEGPPNGTLATDIFGESNARRFVAAWNAANDLGISTASLESGVLGELVEALEALRSEHKNHCKRTGDFSEVTWLCSMEEPCVYCLSDNAIAKLKGTP